MTEFNTNEANIDNSQKTVKQPVDSLIEPYIVQYYREAECYPGLIFQQGGRQMIQINVPASHVPVLLEAKPSSEKSNDPHSGKNRPLVKGHADEIKDYVVSRARNGKPWVLGTLTANVAAEKIDIVNFGKGVCLVIIPKGVSLDITDGQHRTRAIQELRQGSERKYLSEDAFPITLVLEDDFRQCQTDFRDMAQAAPLPKSLLVSFGALGRDGITQKATEFVDMFRDKTQRIKISPGSNTKFIYTSNYIAKAVSCAFANNPNHDLLNRDADALAEVIIEAFNQFFSECADTLYISQKNSAELSVEEVNTFKENCILGVSVGLEVLGRLMYHSYDKDNNLFSQDKITQLAKLDWSRKSVLWRDNLVRKDPNPKDPSKPYKISASATNVKMALDAARRKLSWV